MDIQQNLSLLKELISCNQPLYYWCYDHQKHLLESNCPYESILEKIIRHSTCLDYAIRVDLNVPLILSHPIGLMWIAQSQKKDGKLSFLHIIGPCFTNKIPESYVEQLLCKLSNVSIAWKKKLAAALHSIPTLPSSIYCQYAIMLCYCITGQKFTTSDLHYQTNIEVGSLEPEAPQDRLHVYQAEQMLLSMVREGNLNSKTAQIRADNITQIKPYVDNPLEQLKIACIIFTSLCTRAAIEGGLSPEESYSLGDSYIKGIGLAKAPTEVTDLKNQMYQDFILRVHKCRTAPPYSKPIQSCVDYIKFHIEEKLSIEILASRLGYTKYYLSRCFKTETGYSVSHYIKIAKMEYAKVLLANTQYSISDITERLNLCSRSYFTDNFKKLTGQSPAQYREEHQRL